MSDLHRGLEGMVQQEMDNSEVAKSLRDLQEEVVGLNLDYQDKINSLPEPIKRLGLELALEVQQAMHLYDQQLKGQEAVFNEADLELIEQRLKKFKTALGL